MALLIGDNFNYQANKPNFVRDSFATLAAMRAYPETSIDDGHISYCAETDKHYKFLSTNIVDATTGKWREFKTGTSLPEEGNAGQVLTKTEDGYEWQDPQAAFPEGGTAGQVLKKTSSGVEWGTDEKGFELPSGGTNGQVLTKTSSGTAWQDAPTELPSGGTVGQVLKKTSNGVAWQNDNNTTYNKATQQTDGLMSKEDKAKLDGLTGASLQILTQEEYDSIESKEDGKVYFIRN